MRFFTPIIQSVLVALVLAILGGAWKVYADVQEVKSKVTTVTALSDQLEAVTAELQTLGKKYDSLPSQLDKQINTQIDRRLADVPLCRRR